MNDDLFHRLMEYASIGFFLSGMLFLFIAVLKTTQVILQFIQ